MSCLLRPSVPSALSRPARPTLTRPRPFFAYGLKRKEWKKGRGAGGGEGNLAALSSLPFFPSLRPSPLWRLFLAPSLVLPSLPPFLPAAAPQSPPAHASEQQNQLCGSSRSVRSLRIPQSDGGHTDCTHPPSKFQLFLLLCTTILRVRVRAVAVVGYRASERQEEVGESTAEK